MPNASIASALLVLRFLESAALSLVKAHLPLFCFQWPAQLNLAGDLDSA
jgi:hypothetical protein